MIKFLFFAACTCLLATIVNAQNVGIGTTTPNPSAKLDIQSNNSGVLVPRMTAAQRNAIANPATGLLVFVTDNNSFYFNSGTPATPTWISLSTGFNGWGTTGNAGTNPANNFVGTTDNSDLTFRVNNQKSGLIQNSPTVGGPPFGNTSFGYLSLANRTDGSGNTAIGHLALNATTWNSFNTAIGFQALAANMANSNTAVGHFSLAFNITGTGNTALGTQALGFHKTGDGNVAIGQNALASDTSGNYNVGIGVLTLNDNKKGNHNIGIGLAALGANTVGNNNIAVGNSALISNSSGENNIAIGRAALKKNTHISNLIAIGDSALFNNGTETLFDLDGIDNLAIGTSGLKNNTNGFGNLAIGNNALALNTVGDENVAVGRGALGKNIVGSYSVAIGSDALRENGSIVSNSTGSWLNTAIGHGALSTNVIGNKNTAVGSSSMYKSKGSENIALGTNALENLENGNRNIGIGIFSSVKNATQNNSIAIGTNARVDCDNCMVLGSVKDSGNYFPALSSNMNIGIGTTHPRNRLHLHNNEAANSTILQITHANTGLTTTDGLLLGVNTAQEAVFNNQENTAMKFATNNTVQMTIAAGGDVTLTGKINNESWQTPAFNAGWNNYGGSYAAAAFYKDKVDRVHLRGLVNVGVVGSTIFNLPPGYRPSTSGILMFNVNNGNALGRIDIQPNGNVNFVVGPSAGSWVSLDGISFRAD
jgi:hypothetical protein